MTACKEDGCYSNALPGGEWCVKHTGKRAAGADEETLLPFEAGGTRKLPNHILIAETHRVFKPRGLMIWNAGELQVQAVYLGRNVEVLCSFGKVPAAWWESARTFEAVVSMLANGQQPGAAWGTWSQIYPGQQVRLEFDGPAAHVRALMWGHSPR